MSDYELDSLFQKRNSKLPSCILIRCHTKEQCKPYGITYATAIRFLLKVIVLVEYRAFLLHDVKENLVSNAIVCHTVGKYQMVATFNQYYLSQLIQKSTSFQLNVVQGTCATLKISILWSISLYSPLLLYWVLLYHTKKIIWMGKFALYRSLSKLHSEVCTYI